MPTGYGSREPWTNREDEIVCRFYAKGAGEVAALLPGRTIEAIRLRAKKLGVAGSTPQGLRKPCAAEDRDAIIGLHDQGMSYEAIARTLGIDAQAVSNAILAIECERAGFTPAQRDASGGLVAREVRRMRDLILEGLPNVEIQRRMAVSASCVSHHRRRMNKAGERVPAPGQGLRYSGSRYPDDVRAQVDLHFMQGYGCAKVAELTGIHVSAAKRRRRELVQRLAARNECLPGCDLEGKRIVVRESASFITPQQKVDLQWLYLRGWPTAPAADYLGIGRSKAYEIVDAVKAQLRREGKPQPRRLPSAQRPALPHPPTPKAKRIPERPKPQAVASTPALRRPAAMTAAAEPVSPLPLVTAKPQPARRPLSLEEQLARIAAGAKLVPAFRPTRPLIDATLGGVGSGLL
jgi:transposase